LAFLRRVFNVARWNKLVAENPVEVDQFYDEPSGRVRFLTEEEEPRLQAELSDYEWKIVLFSMATGMRQGAQFRLHWTKVDLPHRFATIPKKRRGGVAVQRVPLNDIAVGVLRSLPSRFKGGYVFPSATGSTPLNPKNFLNRVFYPALERAGIADFHWHDLRHTFASRLAMRNVHQKAIKELMGHETLAMTDRYMHLSPVHLHEAANKFYAGGSSGGSSAGHKGRSRVTHSAKKSS
jgi:integrase